MSKSDSEEGPEAPRRRRRRQEAGGTSWRAEVEWVFLNLDSPDEEPLGAPSSGSIGLLRWARANRDAYFRTYVVRMLPSREVGKGSHAEKDPPKDEGRELLEEMVKRYAASDADIKPPKYVEASVARPQQAALPEPPAPLPTPVVVTPPLLCVFCQRHGVAEDCGGCWDLRRQTTEAAASSRTHQQYDGP